MRHLALLCVLATAPPAAAQAVNVDIGDFFAFGLPSSSYGAAAAQPGAWNSATSASTPAYATSLVDLAGNPTPITTSVVSYGNGAGDFAFNNAGTTGDDQALMDDLQDIGAGTSITFWTFDGLADGPYDLYTYAWAPDDATFVTTVTISGRGNTVSTGGAWPGMHVEGVTYARHCVQVTGGQLVVEVQAAGQGFATLNGFQLVPRTEPCPGGGPGTSYCLGDGSASTCPCGNTDFGGSGGCKNSTGAGCELAILGTTAPDSLELIATNAIAGQPGLFFQGDNSVSGGAGVTFGDGLRCAGGAVVRIGVKVADAGGTARYGPTQGDAQVSQVTGAQPGETKRYQFWYRDPQGSPCGTGFNLSNGYELTW